MRCVSILLALLAISPVARAEGRADECADQAERGQELRDSLKLVEARRLFVSCAQLDCPSVVRGSCTEFLADVDRRTPSVVVKSRDDQPGVKVTMDATPLPDEVLARAVRVNPGKHAFRYELEGFTPITEDTLLREGEGVRVLEVAFTPPPKARAEERRTVSPAVYALGTTAAVGFALFGYFGLSASGDYRRLERDCAPHCAQSDVSSVHTRLIVADVALLAGILSVGGAAAVYFLTPRSRNMPRAITTTGR
jgi:hypothetical protein